MENVIEIVSFKLLAGTTSEDFIVAANQSQKFVATLKGFQYRSLSHNAENDTWTDVVYWDSMEDAKSAGEQFVHCAECQPLMALIDSESVNMQHQVLRMCDLAAKYQ
ncbi:hypothetical protein [Vibrio neptunius]|uniref:hypothetical protein n=1 Tax=Vibrio neptunius TaxID=170651 RepID=UPI0019D0F505|nr:hypothetical protein [Vibrio neptunius]MBN3574363.1 hypothetical protein [Vibrio neptunius]QXX08896.1 hypothetical protein KW548_17390 [Vibrio neptunius]